MLRITLLGPEPSRRRYGTDAQGFHWATFDSHSGTPMPCALCGARIIQGWWMPAHNGMPERHICSSHVETVEPAPAQAAQ